MQKRTTKVPLEADDAAGHALGLGQGLGGLQQLGAGHIPVVQRPRCLLCIAVTQLLHLHTIVSKASRGPNALYRLTVMEAECHIHDSACIKNRSWSLACCSRC